MVSASVPGGFEADVAWERMPEGLRHDDVSDVAVDAADNVYLLTRMDPQVVVYDRDGNYQGAWGRDVLSVKPHGLTMGPDDTLYLVDELRHSVERYSTDGKLISTVGPAGTPSDTGVAEGMPGIYALMSSIERAAGPYNRPTKVAVAPNGDRYVTDGYGNARVHRFDADGDLIASWGEPGTGPGQFHLPHSLAVLPDGRVLVCDRENDRIQVFEPTGEYVEEWTGFRRPAGICHRDGLLYVVDLGWMAGHRSWVHGVIEQPEPPRLLVLDENGRILLSYGGPDPCAPGGFSAPHGLCVDSRGSVYVAEVTCTMGKALPEPYPPGCHTFVKLTPTGA